MKIMGKKLHLNIYILNHVNDDIPLRLEDADNDQKRNIEAKTVKVHFANGKRCV